MKVKEDGEGGNPSNAMFTGQVADNPNRRLFRDIYRRTRRQRAMDDDFKKMFDDILLKGK